MTLGRKRALWLAVLILLLGSALRMVALEQSPPGFSQDEACESYDAYSIWHTGRDQHGVFLPVAMRAFNDYRMPLFIYSMAPIVGTAGLSVTPARLTAAFWGILAIAATFWIGTQMFGHAAGLVAALFLAISPWHVPFGRIAHEGSTTVLVAVLSVGMLWRWQRTSQKRWLIGAATFFALGIYTYAVMKLFFTLMIVILGLLFWRTVAAHRRQVLGAVVIGALITLPMVYITLRYPDEMQARYRQIAVFQPGRPLSEASAKVLRNAWHNTSPDFLFRRGDTHEPHHPKGLGQLYPIQALLILAGIGWGLKQRATRLPLAIISAWILAGILPAALTVYSPGTGHALRSLPAVVPWQLLSGLGVVGLLSLLSARPARLAIAFVILAWVGINALGYFGYYFTRYPTNVLRPFDVGMREVVSAMDKLDNEYNAVYFTCSMTYYPYIDILFFTRYDPHRLQADLPDQEKGLFSPVLRVGKYHTVYDSDTEALWAHGLPGLFVIPANALPDVPPLAVTTGAEGQPMCKIVGRDFFPYNIDSLEWLSQCSQPAAPLSAELIAQGVKHRDIRQTHFDCTLAWLYPEGGSTLGAYVIHHDLVSQPSKASPAQPRAIDPFIARRLVDTRLALEMPGSTKEFPAFVIYEQKHAPTLPAPAHLSALPATALPAATTLPLTTPVSLAGPLTFLGAVAYPDSEELEVETWWRVVEGPITRSFSIMAHLLTPDGETLGVADGLGVFPLTLQAGDIAVQRHHFQKPSGGTPIWLRTGAYWLDTMDLWPLSDVGGADAIFMPMGGDREHE